MKCPKCQKELEERETFQNGDYRGIPKKPKFWLYCKNCHDEAIHSNTDEKVIYEYIVSEGQLYYYWEVWRKYNGRILEEKVIFT